ncbi:hypothetical protein V8E54_002488 [Elaphomyces granulatus]
MKFSTELILFLAPALVAARFYENRHYHNKTTHSLYQTGLHACNFCSNVCSSLRDTSSVQSAPPTDSVIRYKRQSVSDSTVVLNSDLDKCHIATEIPSNSTSPVSTSAAETKRPWSFLSGDTSPGCSLDSIGNILL